MRTFSSSGVTWLGVLCALAGPGLITSGAYSATALAERALWLGAFVAMTGAIAIAAVRGERLSWCELGFRNTSWRSVVWAAGLAAFSIFIYGPLTYAALSHLRLAGFERGISNVNSLPR